MKKYFNKKTISFILIFISTNIFSQIGINTAAPRATLDVAQNSNSTTTANGFIAPTISLKYLVENDHLYTEDLKGVMVYVDDVTQSDSVGTPATEGIIQTGYYYFNGSTWTVFVVPESIEIPEEPWKNATTGADAKTNYENIVHSGQVGIGFNAEITPAAQLEIRSSSKGLLIPRLTTSERDEIINVPNSLIIYNTDTDCFNFYKKNKWKSLCGDLGQSEIIVPDCNSGVIKGEYKVGQVLDNSNYFEITVNVVEPGDFSILVNDANSTFFFQKSGVFPNTGEFTIQIPAIGTPAIAGTKSFTVTINEENTTCITSVIVSPPDISINDIKFISAESLVTGQSSASKTMSITASVGINTGAFNFQTNSINGLSYSANNINIPPNAVDYPVSLMANGNPPSQPGTFQYDITGTGYSGPVVQGTVSVTQNNAGITSINCGQANVNGIYKLETALTASNYIDIPVVVNSIGTYNISVTNATAGFSFTGTGNVNTMGNNTIRVFGSGTPTVSGTIPFTVTINGTSCNLDVNVLLPKKSILLVGDRFTLVTQALNNTANFGPNGKSKTEGFSLIAQGNNMTAVQLRNAINTQGVQIIIVGWSWGPDATCINILADFVKNKKGFIYWVEGQNGTNYIGPLLSQIYGGNVTMTNNNYSIYTAKFDSNVPASNPYLNGVFGNAQNKYLRADDAASWIGVVPSTMPSGLSTLISLTANGGSGTGSNSPRNTQVYGEGFFMFSDWGMTNKTDTAYGTYDPIGFSDKDSRNVNTFNGTAVVNATIPAGDVANWVVFGNAMDYIIKYVEQNYNASYQIP